MESLLSLTVGVLVGGLIITVLSIFPGKPFDFDQNEDTAPKILSTESTALDSVRGDVASLVNKDEANHQRALEVERAAQQVKVERLQELLGLEREEVKRLVAQAKQDTINGVTPPPPTNYSTWLDRFFYVIMFGLLLYVLSQDYNINMRTIGASLFPRETETMQKLLTGPWRYLQQLNLVI